MKSSNDARNSPGELTSRTRRAASAPTIPTARRIRFTTTNHLSPCQTTKLKAAIKTVPKMNAPFVEAIASAQRTTIGTWRTCPRFASMLAVACAPPQNTPQATKKLSIIIMPKLATNPTNGWRMRLLNT